MGVHLQINPLKSQTERTVIFIIDDCADKGVYPYERTAMLAKRFQHERIVIFVKSTNESRLSIFTQSNLLPIPFTKYEQLIQDLQQLQPDLVIRDGKNSEREQIELIKPYCKTLVHLDDYGNGNVLAHYNLLALYPEQKDMLLSNMMCGPFAFALPEHYVTYEKNAITSLNDPPHIVVAFEDGDPHNLTYRTLRHLTQLHIPLQITVVIDDDYAHTIEDLQMMVLSRRSTSIARQHGALTSLLPSTDIIICNANYTPYKIAAYGVPCITLAQHEHELCYAFPREQNGFIHLGLGRKMKQSHIQNAVMELLLHEARRERAIQKQRQLALDKNIETLQTFLLDLAHDRHNIASI